MKSRLFRKIFAAYAVTVLIVIALESFMVALETRRDITGQIKAELITNGRVLMLMSRGIMVREIKPLAEALGARVTIIDAEGIVLADSEGDARRMDNHLNRPEVQGSRFKGQGSAIRYSQTLGIDMMYVALSIKKGENITGYIRLARPLGEVKTVLGHFTGILFRAALIIIVVFLLFAFYFIPKFTEPLLRIIGYTEKVRGGNIVGTLMVQSRDEMGHLADNINLLVKKYEDTIRQVREEREKLVSAFASMVEGIVILDGNNRIELVNKGMLGMLGRKPPEVTGKTPLELFRNVELQDALESYRKGREAVSQTIVLENGEPRILNVTIAPIRDVRGDSYKTIMVFHDITKVRKLERIRADFVANATHEIKTPLTAIIGFVETLQEGAIEDRRQARRFLDIISDHALRLNRLVDDLLVLSALELGEAELHLEPVSLADVVSKSLALVETRAKEKGLYIRNEVTETLPLILADRDRIVQVLVNVLDNAVKFTSEGGVTLSALPDREGYAAVVISDTGMGIPRYDLPRLGERFYRVDKMRSRELGGTGLGLSIVKHLMQAHHGWMEMESTPGAGTAVKLFFPLSKDEP